MFQLINTFEKLLACVLLEEGFVDNGTAKIVNHKLEHGLNLFFCVASVVGKSSILL